MCISNCKECDNKPEAKDGYVKCINPDCEEYKNEYLVGEWNEEMKVE